MYLRNAAFKTVLRFSYDIHAGGDRVFESTPFGGGRIVGTVDAETEVRYFLTDHLGSVRVVATDQNNVLERNDYYPFGKRWDSASLPISDNRDRFNAQATGGCVDSARVSVPKFGRSEGSKAAWAARNVKKSDSSTLLQKLNFTDSVPQPERESIETELSILPQWQRDRAESLIDKVVLTDSSASGSGYDYRSRTLYVHPDHSAGDMIHEYGHALEISLDLRHNQKYIEVRRSGLDLSDLSKVVLDSGTYTEYVQYLTCDKFISTYQGRLYESPDYGIFKKDSSEIDEAMLKEYFSEGFRAFYKEPALLKEKDPKPYEFIEGLSDDQK